jgi:hypothetical protein
MAELLHDEPAQVITCAVLIPDRRTQQPLHPVG